MSAPIIHIHIPRRTRDRRARDVEFVESEHPRRSDGEFTNKGGGASGMPSPVQRHGKPQPRVGKPVEGPNGHAGKPNGHAQGIGAHEPITHGGKGVGWLNAKGEPLSGPVAAKLKTMKKPIPPGWTNVRIATDPNSRLLVQGVDAKGRPTRIYSSEHSDAAAQAKFARVKALNERMPALVNNSRTDMLDPTLGQRQRDTAATVYLVALTGFRPGSTRDTKAEEQAYGASTLEKRHIKVTGDKVTFTFTGKKGVAITKILQDKTMAEYLQGKMADLADKQKVFETSGDTAMAYLRKHVGEQFKLKDLRTWNGTSLALKLIGDQQPMSEDSLKALQKRVSTAVSEHLGNTPKIAFESYIDPSVWPVVGPTEALRKAA